MSTPTTTATLPIPSAERRILLYGIDRAGVDAALDDEGVGAPGGPSATVDERPDGVLVELRGGDGVTDLDPVVERLCGRWGDDVVSPVGETLPGVVIGLLEAAGLCACAAESLTSGLLAHHLCEVPGAGQVFAGSVVAYASEVKYRVLGVPEGPVVSEVAARAMVQGACRILGAPASIALTGVAGPAEQDGQPVGTVYVASAVEGDVRVERVQLDGEREEIELAAVHVGLDQLRRHLLDAARKA